MALDIIFLSYDEPNADKNWSKLIEKFPYAKRVNGVEGIRRAHVEASNISSTTFFYVVDGDSEILDNFDFSFKPKLSQQQYMHVWRSKNPVNGLEYGYGGIKILSKHFFKDDIKNVDITTSLTEGIIIHDFVASLTRFNSDPFRAWRGAFRECVKLSSKVIQGQIDDETANRLNIWCSTDIGADYGDIVLLGANEGRMYGERNKDNKEALLLINDFSWLNQQFDKHPIHNIHKQ